MNISNCGVDWPCYGELSGIHCKSNKIRHHGISQCNNPSTYIPGLVAQHRGHALLRCSPLYLLEADHYRSIAYSGSTQDHQCKSLASLLIPILSSIFILLYEWFGLSFGSIRSVVLTLPFCSNQVARPLVLVSPSRPSLS
jgi:hypothetical protein